MKPALLAVPLVSFLLATASSAQEAGPPPAAEGATPWAVICRQAADGPCVARQRLQRQEDRRQILMAGVLPAAGGETGTLRLLLPLGIDPTAPVAIGVDGEPLANPPLRACLPRGCEVLLPLDAEAIAMMRGGVRMEVGLQVAGGRSFELPVDLRGFSAAFDRAATGRGEGGEAQ